MLGMEFSDMPESVALAPPLPKDYEKWVNRTYTPLTLPELSDFDKEHPYWTEEIKATLMFL